MDGNGFPEEIIVDLSQVPLQTGQNILAIEVHNFSNTSSDLSCIPFLTIGYTSTYENMREPDARINIPSTYLHSNFKIKSSGETIVLSNNSGAIIDSLFTGLIPTDKSKGRTPQARDWKLFDVPSPGSANPEAGYNGFLSPPVFSIKTGFFNSPQIISLAHSNTDAKIYFTLDGSVPNENSNQYSSTLTVSSNTPLRAR